ncbi:MAG: DUF2165 family protein [Pseudomonadota bacterium]
MDMMVLIAQTCLLGYLAAWMITGVRDNIVHPSINGVLVQQVMELRRMQEEAPDEFHLLKSRRITNRRTQRGLFVAIVIFEFLTAILLLAGVAAMALAVFGAIDAESAKVVALAGALSFTTVWCGMLVVGNHFAYWCFHEGAQNTHFQLACLGVGEMILLAAA